MKSSEAQNRRTFLRSMISAAAASSVLVTTAEAAQPSDAHFLYRMLGAIEVGEPFYENFDLIDAYPPTGGALILVVARDREEPIRVDVVRRADPVRAPAYTEHLELYVMDGGAGKRKMPEDLVQALQALADRLQDNEAQYYLAEKLLTHKERLQRHPALMARAASELAPQEP